MRKARSKKLAPRKLIAAQNHGVRNLVSTLGWSRKRTAQVRSSLVAFEADWNAPGMEAYDRL